MFTAGSPNSSPHLSSSSSSGRPLPARLSSLSFLVFDRERFGLADGRAAAAAAAAAAAGVVWKKAKSTPYRFGKKKRPSRALGPTCSRDGICNVVYAMHLFFPFFFNDLNNDLCVCDDVLSCLSVFYRTWLGLEFCFSFYHEVRYADGCFFYVWCILAEPAVRSSR